ncbi:substrate-binding domain-containing protein [Sphingomonas sp. MMS24-JH45]
MARRRLPLVRLQPGVRLDTSPCVYIDNEQAAVEMTAYLIALGHRRIGFVVGDRGYAASAQRLNGYVRAMTEAGLGMDLDLVRQGDFGFDSGVAAADELLSLSAPPTAIFAANDDMAAGVLSAAHQRGLPVPGALSVVGFDDLPIARMLWPLLTTIRQPVRLLAEIAASLLLEEEAGDTRRCVEHELIVREFAGPPPRH